MRSKTILEVATYEGQWVVLRDGQLVSVGHATQGAAKQAARRCVNYPSGYRFNWVPGSYYQSQEHGVEVIAYHSYAGKAA